MYKIKLTSLIPADNIASNDLFEVVDVNDPTMSPVTGTNKRVTAQLLANSLSNIVTSGANIVVNSGGNAVRVNQSGAGNILSLENNSNARFVINSSGNVGIGTASPTCPLDISSAGIRINPSRIISSNSNSSGIVLAGGAGANGANIELYGSTHGSSANMAYVDANTTYFRNAATTSTFASISSSGISSPNYLVTGNSTIASGIAVQRVLTKTIPTGHVARLAEFTAIEGNVAIEIQVSSNTQGNSGTSTYRFQGGYNTGGSILPSTDPTKFYRLYPFNDGRGHGSGTDTGLTTTPWMIMIYHIIHSGQTGGYGVAIVNSSGTIVRTVTVTITELRRGMSFTDKSADATVSFGTPDGNLYSHTNLLVGNRIGIGKVPTTALDVNGTITASTGVAIGLTSPTYQLHLSTDSAAKPSSTLWTISSDERLKENIETADLDICYNAVKSIPLKRYKWKDEIYSVEQVADRSKIGWIAQDVQEIFPKAVSETKFVYNQVKDENGNVISEDSIDDCLSLNADQIYATLFGAVQKLIVKVESLESKIDELENA